MNETYVDFLGNSVYAVQHPKMSGVKSDVTLAASNLKSVPVQLLISSSPRDERRVSVRVAPAPFMLGTAGITSVHSTSESFWNGRVFINPEVEPTYSAGAIFTVITDGEMRYVTPFVRVLDGEITTNSPVSPRRYDRGGFIFGAGPRLPLLSFFSVNSSLRPGLLLDFFGPRGEILATDRRKTSVVTFNADGAQLASVNFNPAALNLSVKGRYTVEATDNSIQFPDVPQQLKLTMTLDTSREDYLPPTLTGIYLVDGAGNAVRDARAHAGGALYFSAADYSYNAGNNGKNYLQIRPQATTLWYRYSGATAWTPLAVSPIDEDPPTGYIYRADLRSVTDVDWARVDLKIDIEDSAGNTASVVMQPAFSVGSAYPVRRGAAP